MTATQPATAAGDVPGVPPVVPPTHPRGLTTFPGTDGARFTTGAGSLPNTEPLDVALPGKPLWVVGVPVGDEVAWSVALAGGAMVEVRVSAAGAGDPVPRPGLGTEAPPALAVVDGDVSFVHPPQTWGSALSHPLGVGDSGFIIEEDGRLRVERPDGVERFDLAIPTDARLLTDGERVMVVTGATTRYPHAALGDTVEGSSVALIDGRSVSTVFELADPAVLEGTVPMWVDLDGDGAREIVVTVSDPGQGARLVLYDELGRELAMGPAIGQGNRWRHQVAAAPFGVGGEMEVAAVRTPHIGGEVQFHRWVGDRLEIVARVGGFSSHRFLSRNLDMALAADADGDGAVELLVPTDDYRTLGGIRRTDGGADVAWTVDVGGVMSTNLGIAVIDGSLSFAVGTEDATLRIWP